MLYDMVIQSIQRVRREELEIVFIQQAYMVPLRVVVQCHRVIFLIQKLRIQKISN